MPDLKVARKAGQDIYTVNFADYLPGALKHDLKMRAIAEAVTKEALMVSGEIENVLIYSRIDELPEELIDILAYDMHVDWYDYSYPLQVKRDILKRSVKVHKKMGTKYAIKMALSSLYKEVKIIEWFEYGGNPYTFRVEINVTDYYETIENKNRIIKIIYMYKRLSAHLEFIIYRVAIIYKVEIKYDATITYTNTFYPRYNVQNLYLDGTWFLDGTYTLDGYADNQKYDFYPVQLIFSGGFLQDHKIDSIFQTIGMTFFPVSLKSKALTLFGTASTKLEQNGKIEIFGYVKQEVKRESSLVVAGEIFSQMDSESKEIELVGDVSVALEQKAELELVGCAKQNVEMAGCLEVEKDLWFLDGTYALDGEKLLDAEIFHYEE